MLQPDPRSGEGCNTLIHEGFAKLIHGKDCYIVIVIYLPSSKSVYDTIKEQPVEISG